MDLTLYHPRVSDDSLKVLTRVISVLIPKRRRRYPLERIVAAILHRVDNGSKWRSLDRGSYLPWHVAYDYYRRWARENVIETANALLVSMLRFLEAYALTYVGAPTPTYLLPGAPDRGGRGLEVGPQRGLGRSRAPRLRRVQRSQGREVPLRRRRAGALAGLSVLRRERTRWAVARAAAEARTRTRVHDGADVSSRRRVPPFRGGVREARGRPVVHDGAGV